MILPPDGDAAQGALGHWEPEDCGRGDLAEALRRRVVADFRDPNRFEESLARLLKALRKKEPAVAEGS